ncbi:hypothetical protein DPMN_189813 [Dreissena polymorpha]|uniref:Uncharacterized protein n=1 Tax=Dreissena polymorpha TaxID=45954 RepID=A0A9D4ICJ3_DREPO|nr:hypothetical protein DPMN_189813 [Dreissena polymorpha]
MQKGLVLPVEGSSLNRSPRLDPPSSFTSLWFFEIHIYYHSSSYNVVVVWLLLASPSVS